MELSIADAEDHIASDHALVGHRDIKSDLQADIPRLRESISAQGQQYTDTNQILLHKRPFPCK
jgi:hypothetical protein